MKDEEKPVVRPSKDMLQMDLRIHIAKRHPRLGFWSRGEHDAQHRLMPSLLNHTHTDIKEEEDARAEKAGASDRPKTGPKSRQRSSAASRGAGQESKPRRSVPRVRVEEMEDPVQDDSTVLPVSKLRLSEEA